MNKSLAHHLYEIYDGEQHWYSARTEKEAIRFYLRDHFGSKARMTHTRYVKEYGSLVASQLADDKAFTVIYDERNGEVTQTAAQWAAERPGECVATTLI